VEVRLSCGSQNFETEARVSFSHMNLGMGLDFCALTPEQELMLVEWLSGGGADPAEAIPEPGIVEASSVPDKALTLRLIKLLRSKGSLKEADVSILLSKYLAKDEDLGTQSCPDLF
jgi:hypothetical protein